MNLKFFSGPDKLKCCCLYGFSKMFAIYLKGGDLGFRRDYELELLEKGEFLKKDYTYKFQQVT